MPRKGPAPKRPLINDPVYGSPLVTQLVNKILLDGKKSTAERIVYGAMEQAREKTGTDPVVTLKRALDNVKPSLEVKPRRVGGATYQVPVEVRPGRANTLALRWLIEDTEQEIRQIESRAFAAAKDLADALGNVDAVAEFLGRQAPEAEEVPAVQLPPIPANAAEADAADPLQDGDDDEA